MSTEVAARSETATAIAPARFTTEQIQAASFEAGAPIAALDHADAIPLPMSTEYWSPEKEGESKRVYVAGIQETDIVDPQTGEVKRMEAVFFLEVQEGGKVAKWMNAGRVLVGNIADAIQRNQIIPGTGLTPIQITYLGQTKNRSNSRFSKRWEILPLVLNGARS